MSTSIYCQRGLHPNNSLKSGGKLLCYLKAQSSSDLSINSSKPIITKISYNGGLTFTPIQLPKTITVQSSDQKLVLLIEVPNSNTMFTNPQSNTPSISGPITRITGDGSNISKFSCSYMKDLEDFDVDTSDLTIATSMFSNCSNLKTVTSINLRKATNAESMFYNCGNLVSIPELDLPKVSGSLKNMFFGNGVLQHVVLKSLSNITNTSCMFQQNVNLLSVSLFDTSKVTDMSKMFYACGRLTQVPFFNTKNVVNFESMLSYSAITSVPHFDTSNGTNFANMLANSKITTSPNFDTRKATNMQFMYANCTGLTTKPNLVIPNGCYSDMMYYGTKFA